MFQITEDPSPGILVQCLAKNYKNGSVVSIGMDKVGVMTAPVVRELHTVHVNAHDRIILVIFSQALYKVPWWWILCDLKHVGAL